jgi:lipid-binding SYLF domain-containing protein
MRSSLRVALVALAALLAASASAVADSGTVRISFVKAGWVIGGSVGSGTLTFRGRTYPLSIGGLSYGFTFGASQTDLHGRVSNIFRPSDIEGVYGAGGAGAAVLRGAQAIVLTNQKGAVLQLSGSQTGLMVNLDLSGMAVSLK